MMLEIHIEKGIARLTLDHEAHGNSFGATEAVALSKVLKDKAVSALVLSGRGTRFFCTGGNLSEQATGTRAATLATQKKVRAALVALGTWPKPTLALVGGDAFGGGTELLSSFDFVLSAPHVLIGFWQRKLGLTFGWGGGARLSSKLGRHLKPHALKAGVFTAYQARDIGLVDEIYPAYDLEARGLELLRTILALPAYGEFKKLDAKNESKTFDKLWMNPTHKKIVDFHSKKK
ncbi:MAG: enoyl-CoA hydratase/isomerase family protein [Bdellovibrionia bacterium]